MSLRHRLSWQTAVTSLALALAGMTARSVELPDGRRIQVNGVELAYTEAGTGRPVLFVHGSGADLRTWGYQLPALGEGFRAIAYSRRFHHPNPPPREGASYSASQHAADLIDLIEQLRAGPVRLVAASYGGAIALLVARDRPDLVERLVVVEPALLSLLDAAAPERAQLEGLRRARGLMTTGDVEGALRGFIDAVIGPGAYLLMPQSTRTMLTDNLPELRLEAVAPLGDPPYSCRDAGRVRAPLLVVTGDASPAFFKAIAKQVAECVPGAERVIVPGAAHAVHAQQPVRFNDIVREFLRRTSPATEPPADRR